MSEVNVKTVSSHELFPIIKELLDCNNQAIFTISGISMLPFLGSYRDQVLVSKKDFYNLKKGEIILFKSYDDNYILHRIYSVTKNGYITMGDGNLHYDREIKINQIIGVVEKVYRKNKEIDCTNKLWNILSKIWMILVPIRKYLLRIYRSLSYFKVKLYQKYRGEK